MGHGKETPRQKMIGMMYLVLTALLALNVSKDVLDAFILVDKGLTKTTENFSKKNASYYTDFDAAYELNKAKVQEWRDKAHKVREMSEELDKFIYQCKKEIVVKSEGESSPAIHENEIHLDLVNGKDNTDIPAEIMILNKRGTELKGKLDNFRNELLGLINDKDGNTSIVAALESTLDTKDPEVSGHKKGERPSWESSNFEHLPLASVITMLSKMQSDVRNAEAEILAYLLGQIDAGSFKFNKIEAVVLANSDYVFKGQEYKARVFLAAYDSTKFPKIEIAGGGELPIEDGKGIYTGNTSSLGTKKWGGTIVLEGDDGTTIRREFSSEYQVA